MVKHTMLVRRYGNEGNNVHRTITMEPRQGYGDAEAMRDIQAICSAKFFLQMGFDKLLHA